MKNWGPLSLWDLGKLQDSGWALHIRLKKLLLLNVAKMLVWQTLTFHSKVSINIPRKSHRERSKSPAHHATSSRQAGGMIMPPPSEAARLAGIIPPPSAGTEGLLPRLNAPGQANPNWIQFWVRRKPRLRLSGKWHGTQNLEQSYSFSPMNHG